MSATGLEVFDKTLQTTNIWLDEIMDDMGPERQVAWHSLAAVLRTIRDRLPPDLAAHLGAQLPLLVRGAYYDQYQPSATLGRTRSLDEFLGEINEKLLSTRPVNSEDACGSYAACSTAMWRGVRWQRSTKRCRRISGG